MPRFEIQVECRTWNTYIVEAHSRAGAELFYINSRLPAPSKKEIDGSTLLSIKELSHA